MEGEVSSRILGSVLALGGDVFLVPVFCMTTGAESLALILMSVDSGREEIPDIVGG
jgi:hypothetical protein